MWNHCGQMHVYIFLFYINLFESFLFVFEDTLPHEHYFERDKKKKDVYLKVVLFGHSLTTLLPTINETLK